MKNKYGREIVERAPQVVFLQEDEFDGFQVLWKSSENSNMANVIASYGDKEKAYQTAIKFASAFGAYFQGVRS